MDAPDSCMPVPLNPTAGQLASGNVSADITTHQLPSGNSSVITNIFAIPEPASDSQRDAFMVTQYNDASISKVYHGMYDGPYDYGSTAKFFPFGATKGGIGVQGLRGCTSIIVISKHGCWMSHIWERDGMSAAPKTAQMNQLLNEV